MKKSEISYKTKIFGIVGKDLQRSLSPKIYNSLFEHYRIDAIYLPFDIWEERLREGINGLLSTSIKGFNITSPYKERCIEFLEEADPSVTLSSSVNLILKEGNRIKGFNTDGMGLIRYLKEWEGIETEGMTAGIMGCGGAGKGIIVSLLKSGFKRVSIFVRNIDKELWFVEKLRSNFRSSVIEIFSFERSNFSKYLPGIDLLINATPPCDNNIHLLDIPVHVMKRGSMLLDINYYIHDNPLIQRGREHELKILKGVGMLLYQAIESFYLYVGISPSIHEVMDRTGVRIEGEGERR